MPSFSLDHFQFNSSQYAAYIKAIKIVACQPNRLKTLAERQTIKDLVFACLDIDACEQPVVYIVNRDVVASVLAADQSIVETFEAIVDEGFVTTYFYGFFFVLKRLECDFSSRVLRANYFVFNSDDAGQLLATRPFGLTKLCKRIDFQ